MRFLSLVTLGALSWLMVGLEALYVWWLPRERPVRAMRPLPPFVRDAVWADLGGKGRPHLEPQIPFLVPMVLAGLGSRGPHEHTALFVVSRPALPPMRQLEYTARSAALTAWVSRHWTIEEVLDAVGSQAWMGPAGHGMEQGASYYWGRPLDALAPHEVATLLAVMTSPRAYDPACKPQSALRGRAIALTRMRDARVIDEDAFQRAMAEPIRVLPACDRHRSEAGQAIPFERAPCHRGGRARSRTS